MNSSSLPGMFPWQGFFQLGLGLRWRCRSSLRMLGTSPDKLLFFTNSPQVHITRT